ncbi:MAG TPA: CocE/NonD family hydrolase [Clostridia bacterium]|nr:CocE/NonD family hydrolase [Clostridia bacterium]
MERFKLYYSGIHISDIYLDAEEVCYSEKDMGTGVFGEKRVMSSEDGGRYQGDYLINPLFINENLAEYARIFLTDESKVTASWGDVYEKYSEKEGMWTRRNGVHPIDVLVLDGDVKAFVAISREMVSVLVKEGYESCTPVKYWTEGAVSKPEYLVEYKGTFMVEMRDKTRLATEVWLPDGVKGRIPAILVRTCYGRNSKPHAYFRYVMRGYALVIQDVRGRDDSEGEWMPMHYEVEDGDDTLNWIATQEWSDGNVGTIGASYLGFVQWAAAASGNEHLKAMVSIVTAGSPFIDIPRKGGALVSGTMAWAFAMIDKKLNIGNIVRDDWDEVMKIRPVKDVPGRVFGREVGFWTEWSSHEVQDEFWDKSSWYRLRHNIKAPAMIISGWYDDNGMGTTEACQVVEGYDRTNRKIILGPWMHNANSLREIHNVPFGNNCLRDDMDYLHQLWFDRHLKGMNNGVDKGSPVEYYTVGDNRWVGCNTWPPENSSLTDMYVTSGGSANTSSGDGKLGFEKVDDTGMDGYDFDPADPAPHIIDMSENELGVPENYSEMEKRKDVLVYTSDALTEDISIAGDVYIEFYASSSARDTDWVVRLTDVDGSGNSIRLCDGVLRAKFRQGFDKIVLLEPGKIEKYVIKTSKVANTFKKDHRIRLQITSGAENLIFPNPNTGNNFFEDTEALVASQKIYHGGKYETKVRLPRVK